MIVTHTSAVVVVGVPQWSSSNGVALIVLDFWTLVLKMEITVYI